MTTAIRQQSSPNEATARSLAEQVIAAPPGGSATELRTQQEQRLLRAIAALERESASREARDSLIAERLGCEVTEVRRLTETMAQEGLLYLKWDPTLGCSSWLSPRGRALL